jgi:predicted nucleic acid-binding protein
LILLDSYGWIEYFTDGPRAKKYEKYVEAINEDNTVIPTIVVYEVYRKVKASAGEEGAIEAYAQLKRARIVELDERIALSAADVSLALNLGMADAVVYATAQTFDAKVVTSDVHFKGMKGVEFIE